MEAAGRAWIARVLNALIMIAGATTCAVLVAGGFSFHVGPIHVRLNEAGNPALFLLLVVLLRVLVALGSDRLTRLLPRAIEVGTLVLVAIAPFRNVRTVSSRTAIALLALLILQWLLTRRSPIRKSALLWPLLVMTAISFAAAVLSPTWSYDMTEFAKGSALYLIAFVAGTASFGDERAIRRLLVVGAASLVGVLVIGFVRLGSGADEHFVGLLDWYAKAGLYLCIALPIVAAMLVCARTPVGRLALGSVLVAGLVALVQTMSRGAWVAAGAAAVVFAMLVQRRLIVLFIAGAIVAGIALPAEYRSRAFSIVEFRRYMESGPQAPLGNRSLAWRCGLEMARERPVFGAGPGNRHFQEAFAAKPYAQGAGEDVKHAHNVYLQLLVDTGVLGLGAFLWTLVAMTTLAARLWRRGATAASRLIAAGILSALSALWIYGLADHYYSYPHGEITTLFWMLGVILVALPVGEVVRPGKIDTHVAVDQSSVVLATPAET